MVGTPEDPLICGYSVDHMRYAVYHMTCSPDTVVVNHNVLQSSQQRETFQFTNIIIRKVNSVKLVLERNDTGALNNGKIFMTFVTKQLFLSA